MVNAEYGPFSLNFSLAFVRISLRLPHFLVKVVYCRFNHLPPIRRRFLTSSYWAHS